MKDQRLMLALVEPYVGKHVIHRVKGRPVVNVFGEQCFEIEDRDVILMAVSGRYAMVRRPRCTVYVAEIKYLVLLVK